jgi:PhnB protein
VKEAFGAQETARVHNEDGTIGHAEFRIGDSVVMAFDAKQGWPETPGFLRLYVEDGDAVYRRALEAGAGSVTEMTDLFFGDRVGRVRDPLGNLWWIQTRLEDVDPDEQRGAQKKGSSTMPCGTYRSPSTKISGTGRASRIASSTTYKGKEHHGLEA